MDMCELDDYVAEVRALMDAYPGYVLLGVEADYRRGTVDEVAGLLAGQPFDYVIGSVHYLGDWGFDDPRQMAEYGGRDIDAVWIEYFELVGEAAESGLFTILGHLDLVKKFGYRPTRALDRELERLVGADSPRRSAGGDQHGRTAQAGGRGLSLSARLGSPSRGRGGYHVRLRCPPSGGGGS